MAEPLAAFLRELRKVAGLTEWQDRPVEVCSILEEELTMELKPLRVLCNCKEQPLVCTPCADKWTASYKTLQSQALQNDPNLRTSCPVCRGPFKTVEDKGFAERLALRLKYEDEKQVVEWDGIKCAACERMVRKPHHSFVCLTCSWKIGKWLLSGKKEDRERIKQHSLCFLCAYRHSLYHETRRNEKNEFRPISQLIGYTRMQVATESDALQQRLKGKGYLPLSLCILYSLWKDVTEEGGRIEIETIDRMIVALRVTKRSVLAEAAAKPDCSMWDVAASDFSLFFQRLTIDLQQWTKEAMKSDGNTAEGAKWACSVAQLLFASVEWIVAIVPEAFEDGWRHIRELTVMRLPVIVHRKAENEWIRPTMAKLEEVCRLVDKTTEELQQ